MMNTREDIIESEHSIEIVDDYDKAISDLHMQIMLNPDCPDNYMRRGKLYRGKYHREDPDSDYLMLAISDFNRAKHLLLLQKGESANERD